MAQRRKWIEEEDLVLRHLRDDKKIKKWSEIAKIMEEEYLLKGRCGKQCRERYKNHFQGSINQNSLSSYEERKLLELNQKLGNRWELISEEFPNRTANFLKNQIYSRIRKSVRKLNRWVRSVRSFNVKQINLSLVYKVIESNDFKFSNQKNQIPVADLTFFQQFKRKLIGSSLWKISSAKLSSEEFRRIEKFLIEIKDFESRYIRCKSDISDIKVEEGLIVSDKIDITPSSNSFAMLNTNTASSPQQVSSWEKVDMFLIEKDQTKTQKNDLANKQLEEFPELELDQMSNCSYPPLSIDEMSIKEYNYPKERSNSIAQSQSVRQGSPLKHESPVYDNASQSENSLKDIFEKRSVRDFNQMGLDIMGCFKSQGFLDQSLFE